MICTCRN